MQVLIIVSVIFVSLIKFISLIYNTVRSFSSFFFFVSTDFY